MSAAIYPPREQFFATKFIRLLGKRCAANEVGADGCWLLATIASTEDARRYAGPVTFFNGQLLGPCGFASEGRLIRARQRCVDSGWLHYQPGGKRKPGVYWVLIPEGMDAVDSPLDEGFPSKMPVQIGSATEGKAKGNRSANGGPPILFPIPVPSPIKSPLPPKGGRALRTRSWKRPEEKTLRDTDALLPWFESERERLGLKDDHETRRRVLAAAERALEVGDDPSKLFASLIRDGINGDWSKLSDDQLERGKQRLREATSQRRASSNGTTSIGNAVAAVLKDRGVTP